jgi:hypothetical protein
MRTKIKTVNKACAPMREGKVVAKTFRIAVVPGPVEARPGDGGLTAKSPYAMD